MKTMENTEDVSLPPAQLAGWGLKIGGDEAHVTEKSHFRTAKKLAKSCTGRKIAETTRKTQFDAVNHKLNGKSRFEAAQLQIQDSIPLIHWFYPPQPFPPPHQDETVKVRTARAQMVNPP